MYSSLVSSVGVLRVLAGALSHGWLGPCQTKHGSGAGTPGSCQAGNGYMADVLERRQEDVVPHISQLVHGGRHHRCVLLGVECMDFLAPCQASIGFDDLAENQNRE